MYLCKYTAANSFSCLQHITYYSKLVREHMLSGIDKNPVFLRDHIGNGYSHHSLSIYTRYRKLRKYIKYTDCIGLIQIILLGFLELSCSAFSKSMIKKYRRANAKIFAVA